MNASDRAEDVVPRLLEEYGNHARVALTNYTRTREPIRHLYRLVADYPERGGRMLRSSLCLAAASAFGCDLTQALAPAVAIELLHNAFLVHDDVEDGSLLRRGQPTLHATHGVPLAVNTGDALCLLAMQALSDHRDQLGFVVSRGLEDDLRRAAFESVEGQAIELGWREDNAVHQADADYLEMILKKTCWYTMIFPIRAGARVALGGQVADDDFVAFGFFLGAAFQIQDDLLNLIGDEARYGKERNGDLQEGKRTLMLIHLLRVMRDVDRDHLIGLLSGPREVRTDEDVAWIRARMDEHGSIEHAQLVAHSLAGAALNEFERAFAHLPESESRRFLEGVCSWVLSRS